MSCWIFSSSLFSSIRKGSCVLACAYLKGSVFWVLYLPYSNTREIALELEKHLEGYRRTKRPLVLCEYFVVAI